MRRRRWLLAAVIATPLLFALVAVVLVLFGRQGGMAPFRVPEGRPPEAAANGLIERGRYLATLGNCAGCHTARGGMALAGGRGFRTDYGVVYSTNLTPDPEHGIGDWSSAEFRHAMRHGVSRNGVLTPVFPYASFRHLSDGDLDALLAYIRSLPASSRPRTPNQLAFPASLPGAMVAWRLLYLQPPVTQWPADTDLGRGAYLVHGIGHCAVCHAQRGPLASQPGSGKLWGARNGDWYAPGLHGPALDHFGAGELAFYLRGGAPDDAGAYGLMADVVAGNLQHLTRDDALTIESYLRTLPGPPTARVPRQRLRTVAGSLDAGRAVYERHCADCHGAVGEGEPGKYPPLRGSRILTEDDPVNLIKIVMLGAVAPSTPANPTPYTMPPFAQTLSGEDVARVANFLRIQENADAAPVTVDDVRAVGGLN